MKKHLMIDWSGEDVKIVVENVSPLEFAAALISFAAQYSEFGHALLVAAYKYKDMSKAGGKLKYIKEVKKDE